MKREWIRVLGLAMVLGVWVAAGCSDDDDDAGAATAVVRVTNTVNGVETVTEVVVTNAPAADVPPAAEAAERSFVGRWRGAYENRDGRCEIDLDIRVQDGEAVRGQFTSSQGEGDVVGTFNGTRAVLELRFRERNNWVTLDGTADESLGACQGPWRDDLGNTGTFRITNLLNQLAAIHAGD